MFARIIEGVTGARKGEVTQVFVSFAALAFLLCSYYLVKPMRDSRFFVYFADDQLARFMLFTPLFSLAVTKAFSACVGRVQRYRLMSYTYLLVALIMFLFFFFLPRTGAWTTAAFFFFASVYFTLVLSILWGVFNTLFHAEQAERSFGFVSLGATLGSLLGSRLSAWMARPEAGLQDYALLVAIATLLIALALTLWNARISEPQQGRASSAKSSKVSRGWDDIKQLLTNPYVRGIAMMVFGLAFVGTMVHLQTYPQIARAVAQNSYRETFGALDPQQVHFENIYTLKEIKKEQQQETLQALWPTQSAASLADSYRAYQSDFEGRTRQFFSNVNFYQGLLGVFLLVVVARLLFKFVGLRFTVLILPLVFSCAAIALMFSPDLFVLQMILVVGGALNYSLNNATKELLYTPTSESVRFQQKPLIEGPTMRVGDVTASVINIAMSSFLGTALALSLNAQNRFLLGIGVAVALLWMLAIWRTGARYDRFQREEGTRQELDQAAPRPLDEATHA